MRSIIKMFERGNVCVDGLRGCGKDMLIANVIARRKLPYISNVDYKAESCQFLPLDFSKLDPLNNYKNFIKGDVVPFHYTYPEDVDIYVSDCGVYFPSQYCSELNRQFSNMPVFQALSRQIAHCNFHTNTQNLNRVWDKIREQSDIYIKCNSCKVLFGRYVLQRVTLYDKYESCLNRVEPYEHLRPPLFANRELRNLFKTKDNEMFRSFKERNGTVKRKLLIYKNLTNYDTRIFKTILEGEFNNE